MFQHIVFFRFRDPEECVPVVGEKLLALKDKIPEIVDIRFGADILHSERSSDAALLVTFRNEADYRVYDEHPDHAEVRKYIHEHRTESRTVDFEF